MPIPTIIVLVGLTGSKRSSLSKKFGFPIATNLKETKVLSAQGRNFVVDKPNLTFKERRQILSSIGDTYKKICIIVPDSEIVCGANFDGTSQEIESFEVPFWNEGWDIIHIDPSSQNYPISFHNKELEFFNYKNRYLDIAILFHDLKEGRAHPNSGSYLFLSCANYKGWSDSERLLIAALISKHHTSCHKLKKLEFQQHFIDKIAKIQLADRGATKK